ncbi:MAG TPA: hypothetical protein VFI47_26825, partial [Acidimicrobiales bacterium]|nr:hypothetical protein [Acidimicrobiales bacterium]
MGSWTEQAPAIAAARPVMSDRAGRLGHRQVGRYGRTVNEVAVELGCDWHTINDTVIAYGAALVDEPGRVGEVTAVGLDETLFCRQGRWRTQAWSTSIVDVRRGRLLDVVEGRTAAEPCRWLAQRGQDWLPSSAVRGDTRAWMWGSTWQNAACAFVPSVSTGAVGPPGGVVPGQAGWRWVIRGGGSMPQAARKPAAVSLGGVVWTTVPAVPVRVTAWTRPNSVAMRRQVVPQRRSATRTSSRASQHNSTWAR